MNNYISTAPLYYDTYLAHHGIKGQKWGMRRYQNEDGTLTAEGRARYGKNYTGDVHRSLDRYIGSREGHINSINRRQQRYNSRKTISDRVYGMNARVYDRLGNKALASMNRTAATQVKKNKNKKYEQQKAAQQEKIDRAKSAAQKFSNLPISDQKAIKRANIGKQLLLNGGFISTRMNYNTGFDMAMESVMKDIEKRSN